MKQDEQEELKKKRFRKFKPKHHFTIYDYSEIEQEDLENKVAELINQDGYYNDIVPVDEDAVTQMIGTSDSRKIAAIAAVIIVSLILVILYVFYLLGILG